MNLFELQLSLRLKKLNLPEYKFKFVKEKGKIKIFDFIRKKYFHLTNEEWVRQNFMMYLTEEKKYPASRIRLEHPLSVAGVKKRCDAVYFNRKVEPEILFEFKAPQVKLDKSVVLQSGIYNAKLAAKYLVISNGIEHLIIRPDYEKGSFEFCPTLPEYVRK